MILYFWTQQKFAKKSRSNDRFEPASNDAEKKTSSANAWRIRAIRPAIYLSIMLLAPLGCTITPTKHGSHKAKADRVSIQKSVFKVADVTPSPKAAEAEARGDFLGAAKEYLNLAQATSDNTRYGYQLQAANMLLRGKQVQAATAALNAIDVTKLPPVYRPRYDLTRAKIALVQQRAGDALNATAAALPPHQPTAFAIEWHRLRAQALDLSGDPANAVREYMALTPLLPSTEAVLSNQNEIWRILTKLSPATLHDLIIDTPEDELSGWRDLAAIAKSDIPLADVEQQISLWQQHYPTHPASETLVQSVVTQAQKQSDRPNVVALLLPTTGAYASTAAAVREGFLMALNDSRDSNGYAPTIRNYDTSGQQSIVELYQRAIDEGAQFVIGPLEKDAVNTLAQSEKLAVPTLALNYGTFNTTPPTNLFQFGLSPEDEALQVAERAWMDGHDQVAIIVPSGEWGTRILQALQEHWGKFGGIVVEVQQFNADNKDYSTPIKALLNLDESEARFRQLRTLLKRDLKFEVQRRHDIDAIFMAGLPNQARQIGPQLNYYFAGDIPVYATSHIYSGTVDAAADRDMNNVMFSDMPWVLDASSKPLRDAIQRLRPDIASRFGRLYALGIDSFSLITQLARLNAFRYERLQAETGNLGLDDSNHIRRQLLWARFVDGVPRLLDSKTAPKR